MSTTALVDAKDVEDEEVVRRVLAGETQLFELLMRRHNQRVFRAARSIVRDDAEAEDVMQDAYVRAYTALAGFEQRARFSTWLTRIAVNEALARVRRQRRFDPLDEHDGSDTEGATMMVGKHTPEQIAGEREVAELVERAVDALPDGFRAVFMLRAVEELSTAETAACLDIPEDTVKTRLFRARALLRDALVTQVETALPRSFSFGARRCDRVVAAVLHRVGVAAPTRG